MIELILTIILVSSLTGIVVILFRKIPVLVKLEEASEASGDWQPLILKIKKRSKFLPRAKTFNYELYLQKILSKIRILTLKTENKTSDWLEKLRQKNNQEKDNYWEELKKAKNGK